MALAQPNKPASGTPMVASEVLGNLDGLDGRLVAVETTIDNLTTDAQTYGNGVFPDGLLASQVSTQLQYTPGSLICNHLFYSFSTLIIDFIGYGADTYYVESDASGSVDIYTTSSTGRTNLNTVIWNGSGFDSVTVANRTELATYQEIIDARGSFDSLELRLDDMTSDITDNSDDIGSIEDGSTPLPKQVTVQTSSSLNITSAHNTINCDTTSNAIALNLPDASTVIGYEFTIFVGVFLSGNDVTLNCNSGDTFDGTNDTATMVLGDIFIVRAVSDNRWIIIKDTGVTLS